MKKAIAFVMATALVVPSVTALADTPLQDDNYAVVSSEETSSEEILDKSGMSEETSEEEINNGYNSDGSMSGKSETETSELNEEELKEVQDNEDDVNENAVEKDGIETSETNENSSEICKDEEAGAVLEDINNSEEADGFEENENNSDEGTMVESEEDKKMSDDEKTDDLESEKGETVEGQENSEQKTLDELVWSDTDVIQFNTGNCVMGVMDEELSEYLDGFTEDESEFDPAVVLMEAFPEVKIWDMFDSEGNYTINIPEENPFFPYEVQFICDGETTNEWFLSPDDSVKVGGHTFSVSAYIDGTVPTQINMEVAGKMVAVYPEKKEFTNDGDGISPMSLIQLETGKLETSPVDLTSYTPIELTQVSMNCIFGEGQVSAENKIAWTIDGDDNYKITGSNDTINLSERTSSSSMKYLDMIVGNGNQLDDSGMRYRVPIRIRSSSSWLKAAVKTSSPSTITVSSCNYSDYSMDERNLDVSVSTDLLPDIVYIGLKIDESRFGNTNFSQIKVYEGNYQTASEAVKGTETVMRIL